MVIKYFCEEKGKKCKFFGKIDEILIFPGKFSILRTCPPWKSWNEVPGSYMPISFSLLQPWIHQKALRFYQNASGSLSCSFVVS